MQQHTQAAEAYAQETRAAWFYTSRSLFSVKLGFGSLYPINLARGASERANQQQPGVGIEKVSYMGWPAETKCTGH